jgi:lipopolysaccharide transport system permease protein
MIFRNRGRYIHTGAPSGVVPFVDLTRALVAREFKGQYRRSLLGPAWAVIQPVFFLFIFLFLRGVLNISSEGAPYAVFAYSALVPWAFFANGVTRAAPSVYMNALVVKKISMAREVYPLAGVLLSFIDFCIAATILLAMMFWYDVELGWALVWIPPLILMVAALAYGVGLLAAAAGTFKRDVIIGIPFLMQFWMLATPIMYPVDQVPDRWRFVLTLNPMAGILESFRDVLIRNASPDLGQLAASAVAIALVWLVAWPTFRWVSQYFADVL